MLTLRHEDYVPVILLTFIGSVLALNGDVALH